MCDCGCWICAEVANREDANEETTVRLVPLLSRMAGWGAPLLMTVTEGRNNGGGGASAIPGGPRLGAGGLILCVRIVVVAFAFMAKALTCLLFAAVAYGREWGGGGERDSSGQLVLLDFFIFGKMVGSLLLPLCMVCCCWCMKKTLPK